MQNDVAVDGGRDSGERGELLPCPFCGFKNAKCLGDDHPTWRLCRVACITMNCGVGGANYNTRAEAIAAWNRRALSRTPDLLAKLERMSDLDCGVCGEEYVGKLWNCPTCKARSEQVGSGEFEKLLNDLIQTAIDTTQGGEYRRPEFSPPVEDARAAVLSCFQRSRTGKRGMVETGSGGRLTCCRATLPGYSRSQQKKAARIAELEARVESLRDANRAMADSILVRETVYKDAPKCMCARAGNCIYCIARAALASTSGSGNG